jgi:hypothetical protein
MSSKKQTYKNDKASSKQQSPKPAVENSDLFARQQSHPAPIIQQAKFDQRLLTPRDVIHLQRTIGNRAVDRQLAEVGLAQLPVAPIQRQTVDVNNHTYKLLGQVPGTNYRIVRRNWRPSGSRYLFNNNTNHLFANTPLTSSEATTLIAVFQDLSAQGVGDLDKLVKHIDHARELTIEVRVTLARLQLIHQNIRDVVRARIQTDHAQVRAMLNNSIDPNFGTAFASLEIPGSDPHKGGQVVVFVNYHTLAGGMTKIVYKPGNLAIDRLLYGDDPGSVASQLGATMANYQVNNLADAGATDERQRHYGYMQYVETQGPQNAGDVQAVYNSLGENLAIAYVFGLRDIHHENFVLLQDRLLFIDMEAATGTFTGFGAMELGSLPNALAGKIANGLVGQSQVVVTGWLPTSPVLKQAVENGFIAKIATLNAGPNMGTTVTAFSTLPARFVPFPTADLQLLGGQFLGKLGARPKQRDVNDFNQETQNIAMVTAGGAGPLQVAYQTLLQHQTTKDALNRGDVPFWTRRGNDVYAEDGALLVAAMPHPRLNTTGNIVAGANTRRGNPAQALADFQAQAAPLLGTPSGRILNDHFAARVVAGHAPP